MSCLWLLQSIRRGRVGGGTGLQLHGQAVMQEQNCSKKSPLPTVFSMFSSTLFLFGPPLFDHGHRAPILGRATGPATAARSPLPLRSPCRQTLWDKPGLPITTANDFARMRWRPGKITFTIVFLADRKRCTRKGESDGSCGT